MGHHCHARNCTTSCAPEYLMCRRHWNMVPKQLQKAVWANYRQGQCDDKQPSESWHQAADRAIAAVARKERGLCPHCGVTTKPEGCGCDKVQQTKAF